MPRLNLSSICPLALLSVTLLAFACGSVTNIEDPDGGPNDIDADTRVLMGSFLAGKVQGLHYETTSVSGLTDANGQFSYVTGETVTFSIGGIELGSALGASEINPFDFFSMEPPSTEFDVRIELINFEDTRDFDRVSNMMAMFLSLDADNDSSNGLDLRGWDADLAGASLSFDFSLIDFKDRAFLRFARLHGANRNVKKSAGLIYLYKALGIMVPATPPSESTDNDESDSIIDKKNIYTYDERGNELTHREEKDTNADGTNDVIKIITRTFDAKNNTLTELIETDTNADTVINKIASRTWTYDAQGHIVSDVSTLDFDANASIDQRTTDNYAYDSSGNQLTHTQASDADGNGITDSSYVVTSTYDAEGNLTTAAFNQDSDGDGNDDFSSVDTYTYDAEGNLLTQSVAQDITGDGSINDQLDVTFTYDADGNVTSRYEERDTDGNGSLDKKSTITYTYNEANQRLINFTEADQGADGSVNSTTKQTYTYDAQGNELTHLYELDSNANGSTSFYFYDVRTFNAEQHVLTHSGKQGVDSTNLNLFTSEAVTLNTYTPDGALTGANFTNDSNGNGSTNSGRTKTVIFDANLRVVTRLNETDADGNGTNESNTLRSFVRTSVTDGFASLFRVSAQ